ncbi:MAG: succinylglutamate desuccinylase/aspartoacylase family protein [Ignavibacteriales bacterium]|nr:succinylglutamate desuccinylase/aspartoacylase family protein [Ignavibacteriales bacterium]
MARGPGPVLALVAGTHGVEMPRRCWRCSDLRLSIDPKRLAGTVVLVHMANMPSFLARTIYYGPKDGQEPEPRLPRQARRHAVGADRRRRSRREVIDRATHVIDIHCGDGNEWLRPSATGSRPARRPCVAASKGLALAFGLDHIVIDTERPNDPPTSVYLREHRR